MPKILANDGIDAVGKAMLEAEGITVITDKIKQENLSQGLIDGGFDGLIVRSATTVRADIIDTCPNLKIIGRAGVGMDNIDVNYAIMKGRTVVNTPASSSQSVAELVFTHFYSLARMVNVSNREMAIKGVTNFNDLKKAYSGGVELKGKTLGIVGFGRIGQAVAKIGVGSGMKILAYDPFIETAELDLEFYNLGKIKIEITTGGFEELINKSDFITLHVPHKAGTPALIGKEVIAKMKPSAIVVNAARGGVIDELALLDALNNNKLAGVGLDVFENEPNPLPALLSHQKISVTPHIGASTGEAQERIGIEMAQKLIDFFKKVN